MAFGEAPAELRHQDHNQSEQELSDQPANQTSQSNSDTSEPAELNRKKQFGVAALFWITFIAGLGVAYLEKFDSPSILAGGLLSVVIGLAIGAAVGWMTNRISDGVFWGTLIAAFGFISVVSDPNYSVQSHRLAWAAVGALSGSLAATVLPHRILINALLCAVAAGAVMGAFYLFTSYRSSDLKFDLYGAPIIGFAVSIFVRLLMWLESRQKMPRYITATWLLIVVIIGNLIGR